MGSRGWAQLLVPAPRAQLLRGLPAARGGPGGDWAPRGGRSWVRAPPGGPGPRGKRRGTPGSRRALTAPGPPGHCSPSSPVPCASRPKPGGQVGGGTSFERETCDARLTALRRTPACGQAREGGSFPSPCLCFWSRTQPGARRGPTLHSSLHFWPVRSGPAGAFAPTPCPGRLARLPLRPSRRAGSPRARGEQGAVTAHPRRCPQWMRDVINLAAFINSPV